MHLESESGVCFGTEFAVVDLVVLGLLATSLYLNREQ